MSEWKRTKEELPDHGQMILAYEPEAVFETRKIRHMIYYGYGEVHKPFVERITHWKEAIKPPKN